MTSRQQRRHTVRARPSPGLPELPEPPRLYQAQVRQRPPTTTRRTWVTMATTTTRETLLLPSAGKSIRLSRVWVLVAPAEAADVELELYFGTGTTASTDRSKVVDILRTGTSAGVIQTRTWDSLSIGRAPTGKQDESLSYRWRTAPANSHKAFIEYVEMQTRHTEP